MSLLAGFAVYFIFWWITLFAVLPFGMRTQAEEGKIVPGSMPSAPAQFRMLRTAIITTIISAILYSTYLFITVYLGWSVDNLPRFAPDHRPL